MNLLDEKFSFLASSKQIVSSANEVDKVSVQDLIFSLLFVSSCHCKSLYYIVVNVHYLSIFFIVDEYNRVFPAQFTSSVLNFSGYRV